MQRIKQTELDALVAGAEVLGQNDDGVSVWKLTDGRFVKLFRRGHMLSTNLIRPYAIRFKRAATELALRGFVSVTVTDTFRIENTHRSAAIYHGVAGVPLRTTLKSDPEKNESLLPAAASLYAKLHRSGIYFRANHFGNLLVHPGCGLALIDIGEAHFRSHSLRPALRARNFKPPLRYDVDRRAIEAFRASRFISLYLDAAALGKSERAAFLRRLVKIDSLFSDIVEQCTPREHKAVSA